MTHAILPPSSADKWVNCSGWMAMTAFYPELEDTEEAREGTAAHELAQLMIVSGGEPIGLVTASNGFPIDPDMEAGARRYASEILAVQKARPHATSISELTLAPSSRIHPLNFGTADHHIWDHRTGDLYIWDYKYGHGFVDAYMNWQLINYAALLMEHYEILDDRNINVHFSVVQPRSFHPSGPVRKWKTNATELRGQINLLYNAASAAFSDKATCQSGAHCKHCSARHACTAAIQAGLNLYEAAWAPSPVALSGETLGILLSIIDRAQSQLDLLRSGLEEEAKSRMKRGDNVDGWALANAYGRTTWTKPKDEVLAFADMMEIDLRKVDLITPNQAIEKGLDASLVAAYSGKPLNGVKVVREKDVGRPWVFMR